MTARALRIGLVTTLAAAALGLGCERRAPAPAATSNPPAPAAPPAAASAPPDAAAPLGPRPTFTLIYSSDLRGRVSPHQKPLNLPPGVGMQPLAKRESWAGLGRRASIVDRARVGSGGVVQVDAGDFLPALKDGLRDDAIPDPPNEMSWRDLVLASYRRLGVDAVTLGERELAAFPDPKALAKVFHAARVPIVLANLVDGKGKPLFPPSVLVDAGGVKVGVFGVAEPAESTRAKLKAHGGTMTSAVDAARAAARDLRAQGAQFIVALVNASAGRARAAEIAAGAGDADAAVLATGGGIGAPDGGVTDGAPTAGAPGAERPRLLTAAGDLVVGRLDVRLAVGQPPAVADAVVELTKAVPEQVGVSLLSRIARIPMKDTEKMEADAKRKHVQLKLRDLYEIWDYGSVNACGFCHPKAVEQWKTTDHAHAFETLVKAKHDRDPSCLGCHTVGFLQPGGTRDMPMARGQFANVGCESCHGPSAPHVRAVDKKKGTTRAVDPVVCLGCHTPDQNVGPFDPIAAVKEILGPGHGGPGPRETPGGHIGH